jgi:hypothetical protein
MCGILLDWLVPAVRRMMPTLGSHAHAAEEGGWIHHAGAAVLLVCLAVSFWLGRSRKEDSLAGSGGGELTSGSQAVTGTPETGGTCCADK